MAILTSYDLKGQKDSFANWISNLSPVDTFFVSTTKKEAVQNTMFQWQTDSLAAADKNNAQVESSNAVSKQCSPTKVHSNVTQILRKAVEVSDTADALSSWGRGKELAYQMEKAGKEIKRDLEAILLSSQAQGNGTKGDIKDDGTDQGTGTARKTGCFQNLVATKGTADADTGAVVHKETAVAKTIKETELFDLTYNLYLAGSSADTIMFHPMYASFFSSLMETGAGREKLIGNMDTTLNKFVGSLIDPLGQQFKLVPNRFMPKNAIYLFRPTDWTQMVLREPAKVQLAKKGSSERYMVEMEIGLRHANPYASGVLKINGETE
ncbi:MAG: SU10 major capsid protein [Bacteroidales bacterium]